MAEKMMRAGYIHCLVLALDKIPMSPRVSGLRPHVDLFKALNTANKEYSVAFELFMEDRQKYVAVREKELQKEWTPEEQADYMRKGLEENFKGRADEINKLGELDVKFELGDAERSFVQLNWNVIFKLLPPNATRDTVMSFIDAFEISDEHVKEEAPA